MADILDMDYINSLPQPFIAHTFAGGEWPVHDIEVQCGLVRIDVCGKLEVKHVSDFRCFIDANGARHHPDGFYADATEAERAQGETP